MHHITGYIYKLPFTIEHVCEMIIRCGEYKRQEINYIKDGKGKTKRFETQYRIVLQSDLYQMMTIGASYDEHERRYSR